MAGVLSRVILYSSFNSCFLQLQKNQILRFLKNLLFPRNLGQCYNILSDLYAFDTLEYDNFYKDYIAVLKLGLRSSKKSCKSTIRLRFDRCD